MKTKAFKQEIITLSGIKLLKKTDDGFPFGKNKFFVNGREVAYWTYSQKAVGPDMSAIEEEITIVDYSRGRDLKTGKLF